MPADYASTAQALSLPISPMETSSPTSESPTSTRGSMRPPWARRPSTTLSQRLSTPYSRGRGGSSSSSSDLPLGARILRASTSLMNTAIRLFMRLTPLQRALAAAAGAVGFVIVILFLIYSHSIFVALAPVAKGWRELSGGWIIIWLMTFSTAFPPMIGYSTSVTIAGFVFGFPGGWPIVATATVAGSTVAFFTSRTVFSKYVQALVGADNRFVALGQVLRHDGLLVLAAIRFCPLPYSLSNGFLATIPSINPVSFALATGLASPKLLVHVFIGSRLALLAESGDTMSGRDKFINYVSMAIGVTVGMGIGLFIYRRTMARAEELARAGPGGGGGGAGAGLAEGLDGELDYADLEEGTLRVGGGGRGDGAAGGESDAAALMDDDDISLWETDATMVEDEYRDDESLGNNK
ncbi:hypothetical protein BX600DRAFT_179602 [Xylariales sp. PMI_506]|nr:hypothetical protein BX600DRAFT_179602 [Xylariales sp. PMI_506]